MRIEMRGGLAPILTPLPVPSGSPTLKDRKSDAAFQVGITTNLRESPSLLVDKAKRVSFLFLIIVAVNVAIGVVFFFRGSKTASAEITTPLLAIEALQSKSLFYTAAARPFLISLKPQVLTAEDKQDDSERVRDFALAAQDPKLWRQLDHKYQFDTLLLSGDPGQYRLLLQHLIETRDWTLTYLDHTSMIFKRPPAKAWNPRELDAMRDRFKKLSTAERVTFLIQAAGKLLAIQRYTDAKHQLDEARTVNEKSSEVWTQLGLYHAHFAQWLDALNETSKALAIDANYRPALASKAQILFSMRRFDDAFAVSQRLVELAPEDPSALFLHAKISHEAHAYYAEIAALRKLVELAVRERQPVSGYRIYLAQAYAADGQALPALEQFQRALAAGDLSAEQRAYIEESIERIKTRAFVGGQTNP